MADTSVEFFDFTPTARSTGSTSNVNRSDRDAERYREAHEVDSYDLTPYSKVECHTKVTQKAVSRPRILELIADVYTDCRLMKQDLAIIMALMPSDGQLLVNKKHMEELDDVPVSAIKAHIEKSSTSAVDLFPLELFQEMIKEPSFEVALESNYVKFSFGMETCLFHRKSKQFEGAVEVFLGEIGAKQKKTFRLLAPPEILELSFNHLFAMYRWTFTSGRFAFVENNHPFYKEGVSALLKDEKLGVIVHNYAIVIQGLLNQLGLSSPPAGFRAQPAKTALLILYQKYQTFDKIPVLSFSDGSVPDIGQFQEYYTSLWRDVVKRVASVRNADDVSDFINGTTMESRECMAYLTASRNFRNNNAYMDYLTHRLFSVVPGTDIFDDTMDNIVKCLKVLSSAEVSYPYTHVIVIGGNDQYAVAARKLGKVVAVFDTQPVDVRDENVKGFTVDSWVNLEHDKMIKDSKFPKDKTLFVLSKTIDSPTKPTGDTDAAISNYTQNLELYNWFSSLDFRCGVMKMFYPPTTDAPTFIRKCKHGFKFQDVGRWHNAEVTLLLSGAPIPADGLQGNWRWGISRRAYFMYHSNQIRNSMIINGVPFLNRVVSDSDHSVLVKAFDIWRNLKVKKGSAAQETTLSFKFSGLSFQEGMEEEFEAPSTQQEPPRPPVKSVIVDERRKAPTKSSRASPRVSEKATKEKHTRARSPEMGEDEEPEVRLETKKSKVSTSKPKSSSGSRKRTSD